MMTITNWIAGFTFTLIFGSSSIAHTAMINLDSRDLTCLNGQWSALIDPTGIGDWRQVWLEKNLKRRLIFMSIHFRGHLN